ncbi:hypothetical protein LCGC14_1728790 [marine sediment metagenome]|uniref:Uncharacterized protein n=1 Tax=marine sediment metagenome TaxID=412755 RepID=A0A0F9JQS3_9ZZZZ
MSGDEKLWEWIQKEEDEVEKERIKLDNILYIYNKIPDVTHSIDRWKNFRLHSATVNTNAVDVDIRHRCGCCGDSSLIARPYINMMDTRVFTIPESFTIGEKGFDGDYPLPGWRTKMLEVNITTDVIDKIEKYFEENKPRECEDEEDDFFDK